MLQEMNHSAGTSHLKSRRKTIPASIDMHSEKNAIRAFLRAREKLLNVPSWATLCGDSAIRFQMTNQGGGPEEGKARPGCFIRMEVPEQTHFQWIMVEKAEDYRVSEKYELFILQTRSCGGPFDKPGGNSLLPEGTRSFVIERDRQYVSATVYGFPDEEATDPSPMPWEAFSRGLLKFR